MDNMISLLTQSAQDFKHIVWPVVCNFPIIGGGELKPVEAVSIEDFKDDLDLLAGIDAWQIDRQNPMVRGLASRVQWKLRHDTFSIRYSLATGAPTEFEKRMDSINNKDNGHLFPYITIQAYLDEKEGNLLSTAAIKTETLFQVAQELVDYDAFARMRCPQLYGMQEMPDGTCFIYLSWKYLCFRELLDQENLWFIEGEEP